MVAGIDTCLQALDLFLQAASTGSWAAREEALKCGINAIYDRQEFIGSLVESTSRFSFVERLLAHARQRGRASWLTLVWKTLLVACDCPAMAQMLAHSTETWNLLNSVRKPCRCRDSNYQAKNLVCGVSDNRLYRLQHNKQHTQVDRSTADRYAEARCRARERD